MPVRGSSRITWIETAALIVFAAACVLLGGSSQAASPTVLILRVLVVCCLVVFAFRLSRAQLVATRGPLILLGAFAATMVIQLVPLPAAIWAGVQGRAPYAAALASLGIPAQAHPLSLAPDRTWNSLMALIVPLAMLLGYAVVPPRARSATIAALLAAAMASAVLGIAQFAAGEDSFLYIYPRNTGLPLGFFANRNHEAAFLALMFPALRAWALEHRSVEARPRRDTCTLAALAIGVFLIPTILVTGSRAGIVLMLLGLAAAYGIAPVALRRPGRRLGRWTILVGCIAVVLTMAISLATVVSSRDIALQRLIASRDIGSDLRFAYLPTVLALIGRFWLFGAGFGAFDPLLRGSEPDALLHGMYFNHAHNDLLELLLTGGVPSMLALVAFLAWYCRRARIVFVAPAGEAGVFRARAAAAMIAMLLLASLLDYPLRTPLLGAVFALLCAWLERCESAQHCRLPEERAIGIGTKRSVT